MRTQVAIIGAGPAGLLLGRLLHNAGVDTVILETRSRRYIENRQRAGVLEQGSRQALIEAGAGDRLQREGMLHNGIELGFAGRRHRVDFGELAGSGVTIYGQTQVVRDLVALRMESGAPLLFEVSDVQLDGLERGEPEVHFRHEGAQRTLQPLVIAGCDGYHGVSRMQIPRRILEVHERSYPFAWLGILADVAPSSEELVYASHDRGFALLSMRSPEVSRLYLQVDPDESVANWSDSRIWDELATRLAAPGWTLAEGPITEKNITPMRSMVAAPMRHGPLFLAGDAAHIVPPTGAKGLNLALADVRLLSGALLEWFRSGSTEGLDRYSADCGRRVWRTTHFSWWMTTLLHRDPREDAFGRALQRARLEATVASEPLLRYLAQSYVGAFETGD